MPLTSMAARDGVHRGDDRDGILLLSKCADWSSHPSHIWEEKSLKFQDNRERQMRRFPCCAGRQKGKSRGKQRVDELADSDGDEQHPSSADLGKQRRR